MTNGSAMQWLVWKDFRMNRLIVFVGLILVAVPHTVALYAAWRGLGPPASEGVPPLAVFLCLSSLYGLALSEICLAFLGGNAIAGERADRSAEFLGYLPVARGRVLASKILAAAGIMALIWAPNLLILAASAWMVKPLGIGQRDLEFLWVALGNVAMTGLMFFCVAWLFSSILESPAIAACVGLITPFLLLGGLYWVSYLLDFPAEFNPAPWYCGLCLVLASLSFAAGTWYYLRRVEP